MDTRSQTPRDAMSSQDFAALGQQEVAYVKPASGNQTRGYTVHSADGTQLMAVAEWDLAYAVVRQNDLEPVAAH